MSITFKSTGVNTDFDTNKVPSHKLRERNVQHSRINNIKELANLYDFGELLGQGVFGTVMEVIDKSTHKTWAVKIVDKQQAEKVSRGKTIDREIQILKIVNHPHIIYLDKIYESNQKIYLVLERCNVELATLLKEKKVFTEDEVRKVVQNLSSAIAYLHKHEIVHRDLKLENILTASNPHDPTDRLYIKVTDFGLGIVKSGSRPEDMLNERCGTLTYMAPEIIARCSYSHQCDVWAMGVVTYMLLIGHFPFYTKKDKELSKMICTKEPSFVGFTASPEAIHLLTKMFAKNPALRITAAEVQHHAWLRGVPMTHDSPENVLDMMRLWRSEMMVVPTGDTSDWSAACLNISMENIQTNTNPLNREDLNAENTQSSRSSKKEQAHAWEESRVMLHLLEPKSEKDGSHKPAFRNDEASLRRRVVGINLHATNQMTPKLTAPTLVVRQGQSSTQKKILSAKRGNKQIEKAPEPTIENNDQHHKGKKMTLAIIKNMNSTKTNKPEQGSNSPYSLFSNM